LITVSKNLLASVLGVSLAAWPFWLLARPAAWLDVMQSFPRGWVLEAPGGASLARFLRYGEREAGQGSATGYAAGVAAADRWAKLDFSNLLPSPYFCFAAAEALASGAPGPDRQR